MDLPLEIMTHIFGYLSDWRDFSSASLACKTWYAASRHLSVQPELDLDVRVSNNMTILTKITDLNNHIINTLTVSFGTANAKEGTPRRSQLRRGFEIHQRMFREIMTNRRCTAHLCGVEFKTLRFLFISMDKTDILVAAIDKCINLRCLDLPLAFVRQINTFMEGNDNFIVEEMQEVFKNIEGVCLGASQNDRYIPSQLESVLNLMQSLKFLWARVDIRSHQDFLDIQRLGEKYTGILHLDAVFTKPLSESERGNLPTADKPITPALFKGMILQNILHEVSLRFILEHFSKDFLSLLPDIDHVTFHLPFGNRRRFRCDRARVGMKFQQRRGYVLQRISFDRSSAVEHSYERNILDLAEVHPEVRGVVFNNCIDRKLISSVFSGFPELGSLQIDLPNRLRLCFSFIVPRNQNIKMANLESLTITNYRDPNIDELLKLQLPRLRTLDLSGCVGLTVEGLTAVCNYAVDLRSLNLTGCQQVTDAAILAIMSSFKRLGFLNVRQCPLLTCDSLWHIVKCNSTFFTIELDRELKTRGERVLENGKPLLQVREHSEDVGSARLKSERGF